MPCAVDTTTPAGSAIVYALLNLGTEWLMIQLHWTILVASLVGGILIGLGAGVWLSRFFRGDLLRYGLIGSIGLAAAGLDPFWAALGQLLGTSLGHPPILAYGIMCLAVLVLGGTFWLERRTSTWFTTRLVQIVSLIREHHFGKKVPLSRLEKTCGIPLVEIDCVYEKLISATRLDEPGGGPA